MCIVLVLNSVRFTRNSDKRFCLFELYRDKWPLPFAIFREFFFYLNILLNIFPSFCLFCFVFFPVFVFFYFFVCFFLQFCFFVLFLGFCLFVCFFNFLFLPFTRSYFKALKHYLHFHSMQILPLIRLLSMTH